MTAPASITSTDSFQARLLRADRWRIVLMFVCLVTVFESWVIRRHFHGVIASTDSVYYPALALLAGALLFLVLAFSDTTRRLRRGLRLPTWRLVTGVALDLVVPVGLMLILQLHSPGGAVAALSAPAILIFPIVIMLSVLRLRPAYSVLTGLLAAAAHAGLATHAATIEHLDPASLPMIYTYGVLLALTGAASGALAVFVRRAITDSVREAEASQRAELALATIERELDIAREIQQGLLPSEAPDLEGFDIAGMARPATQAGGDYYDWQPLPDGRLVVAIADVTGHGVGPALVMAVCRAYARAMSPRIEKAADLLDHLNGLIVSDVRGGRFITMAVALLSKDGSVELLSAGHGPTFLYRASTGEVAPYGGNGLPLGIMEGERYTPAERFVLQRGDALVLLTDGFMERARADRAMYGLDRLIAIIQKHANTSSRELIAAIDADVSAFAGSAPQGDDMTAVVIKRV